jgi:hypothetical protein
MTRIQRATVGLFAAWCIHDLEELVTMSATSRELLPRLPDCGPAAERRSLGWALATRKSCRGRSYRRVATAEPDELLASAASWIVETRADPASGGHRAGLSSGTSRRPLG